MPEHLVITKGLNPGELFLFDGPEWDNFVQRLDKLLEEGAIQRSVRRYFFSSAFDCEVTVQDGEDPVSRLELPLYLFEWAGGFGQGDYTISKRQDEENGISRWEIRCSEGETGAEEAEEIIYQGDLRKLKEVLEGREIISAGQNRIVLDDGTELELVTNLGGRMGAPAFAEELGAAEGRIQSVRTRNGSIESGEDELQTFEILAETETGTVKILEVRGSDEYGELCCFRVRRNKQQTEA